MISCRIVLLAKRVIRDAETNAISVFEILEGLRAASFPLFIPEVVFFAYFTREVADASSLDGKFVVTLGAEKLLEQAVGVNFGDKLSTRLTIRIDGLLIPNPGMLMCKYSDEGNRVLAEYDITIDYLRNKPMAEARVEESAPKVVDGQDAIETSQ